ncbi:hypothetical protein ABW20_dc0110379 [Dactylellina cionopaga]|nr:hypothetical protein ABW20_dc0110379 [Dactylellina cionopaga]
MESIDKQDFDRYRHGSGYTNESASRSNRSLVSENLEKIEPNGGTSRKFENGERPKRRHESRTEPAEGRIVKQETVLQYAQSPRTNLNENSIRNVTSPGQREVYYKDDRIPERPRDPSNALSKGYNTDTSEDSDSDNHLFGDFVAKRTEFHMAAWNDAMQTEKWDLAAEHAKVLSRCDLSAFPTTKSIADSTPAVMELVKGYPSHALELLGGVNGIKGGGSIDLHARTIALTRVDDHLAARKCCKRLIRRTQDNKQGLDLAFFLMAEVLRRMGNNAEAAFYESQWESTGIDPVSGSYKWIKIALEVARKDMNVMNAHLNNPEHHSPPPNTHLNNPIYHSPPPNKDSIVSTRKMDIAFPKHDTGPLGAQLSAQSQHNTISKAKGATIGWGRAVDSSTQTTQFESNNTKLESLNQNLKSQNQNLKSQNQNLESQRQKLEMEHKSLSAENRQLRGSIMESDTSIKRLKFRNHSLETDCESLSAENQQLKQSQPDSWPILPLEEFDLSIYDNGDGTLSWKFPMTPQVRGNRVFAYLQIALERWPRMRVNEDLLCFLAIGEGIYASFSALNLPPIKNANPNGYDIRGYILQSIALSPYHPDAISVLEAIENSRDKAPFNINTPRADDLAINPLFFAVLEENFDIVDALLQCEGIEVDRKSGPSDVRYGRRLTIRSNMTALQMACRYNRGAKVVQALLNADADPNRSPPVGLHPLNLAVANKAVSVNNFAIVDTLVRAGADLGKVSAVWPKEGTPQYERTTALMAKIPKLR